MKHEGSIIGGQSVFSKELAGPRHTPDLLNAGKYYVDIHSLDEKVFAMDADDREWVREYHVMMSRRQKDEFYNKASR
jgi:hypothetical protein